MLKKGTKVTFKDDINNTNYTVEKACTDCIGGCGFYYFSDYPYSMYYNEIIVISKPKPKSLEEWL